MNAGAEKKVLVTGGARGMGEAIVRRLCADGFAVEFTYAASAERAGALAKETGSIARACDLADKNAVEELAATLEEAPAYYGFVHNAGTSYDALAAMVDQAQGERLMQVNFWSMQRLVKALLRPMTHAKTGRIVAIGSVTAERASRGNSVYAASKGAIKSYLTTLTLEVAKRGVTVNTVAPGFVDTDMLGPYAAYRAEMEKQIPAGRFGKADDVAGAVAYLLSPEAAYVSGMTLTIDGGLSAALAVQR
jgi:NAD(P)-dependent dehydrogenase (short-subunit alcohol dehydrogenase family)